MAQLSFISWVLPLSLLRDTFKRQPILVARKQFFLRLWDTMICMQVNHVTSPDVVLMFWCQVIAIFSHSKHANLTCCMLGSFSCFFVIYWFFSKFTNTSNSFSIPSDCWKGFPSECQTVLIQIRLDVLLRLTWVQTVCKGNQQMTLAGKELIYSPAELVAVLVPMAISEEIAMYAWVKVFRIIPEFRILRLTFHRKSASKCWIGRIIIGLLIYIQSVCRQLTI